jgi:hypothetical protein
MLTHPAPVLLFEEGLTAHQSASGGITQFRIFVLNREANKINGQTHGDRGPPGLHLRKEPMDSDT